MKKKIVQRQSSFYVEIVYTFSKSFFFFNFVSFYFIIDALHCTWALVIEATYKTSNNYNDGKNSNGVAHSKSRSIKLFHQYGR